MASSFPLPHGVGWGVGSGVGWRDGAGTASRRGLVGAGVGESVG